MFLRDSLKLWTWLEAHWSPNKLLLDSKPMDPRRANSSCYACRSCKMQEIPRCCWAFWGDVFVFLPPDIFTKLRHGQQTWSVESLKFNSRTKNSPTKCLSTWASRKLPMFEVSQVEVLHMWDRRCFWALGYGAGAWEPAGSDDLDAVAGGGGPGWIVRGWNWGNTESDWPPSTEEPWSQVSFLASVLSSVQDVSTLLLGWEVLQAKWEPAPCVRVSGKPFFKPKKQR